MKLTGHMVQAMGGANSAGFSQFKQHCHAAYKVLRRYVMKIPLVG